jgi:hypothetical protein
MKNYKVLVFCVVLSLSSCGDSKKESLVKDFEEQAGTSSIIDVGTLEKSGTVTGADSLNYYLKANLSEVGVDPKTIEDWTPDSMITHYKKIITSFRTTIDAFKYTASASKEKQKVDVYNDYVTRYTNDLMRDSARLINMQRLLVLKDSVLAIQYKSELTIKSKEGKEERVTKTYLFSLDNKKIMGIK